MIKQFETLSSEDRELLFKAPVLVSVLASSSVNEINDAQKADAVKLAHLKTFTADPLLLPYYAEVEKNFKRQFEITVKKYFPFDAEKRSALKKEMDMTNLAIEKLDTKYARMLHKSLERYAVHVKKATHSIFQDFIFPIPIPGLID